MTNKLEGKIIKEKEFIEWIKAKKNTNFESLNICKIDSVLLEINLSFDDLLNEDDYQNIEKYIKILITLREKIELNSLSFYSSTILLLIYYSEYLQMYYKSNRSNESIKVNSAESNERNNDILTIAYFLSRLNHRALEVLEYKTFSEAFSKLSILFNINKNTINNMRDQFDPYFENGRKGWYQRKLTKSRQLVFDKYKNKSDEELIFVVKEILKKYSTLELLNNKTIDKHTVLKISDKKMKEIKSKMKKG